MSVDALPQGFAQGTARGTVRSRDGDPIAGARVGVAGGGVSVVANASGAYVLSGVPAGEVRLSASASGYTTGSETTQVSDGGEVRVDFSLDPSDDTITDMTVTGRPPATNAATTLTEERVDVVGLTDTIAVQDQVASIDGDVAELTKRSPGVTLRGSFAYIRGLGERRSQTLVNRAVIPSPEPDKRVIPLDLFPTNLVDRIVIAKSYSPDLPGEFSGGSVQIHTRSIPDQDFLELSFGLKYLDGTTFNDFQTYDGGGIDIFGYDDGTRQLPDSVPADRVIDVGPTVQPGSPGLSSAEVQAIGRSFRNVWEGDVVGAPPNHSLNMTFGKRWGDEYRGEFGLIGSLGWDNSYQEIADERSRLINNQGSGGEGGEAIPVARNDYLLDTSLFSTQVSGILNATYRPSQGQTFGLRNLYTHSSEDFVRRQEGRDQDLMTRIVRLRYVERTLFNTQPWGEHLLHGFTDEGWFAGDMLFEWRAGYSLSQRDQPDERQVRYDLQDNTFGDYAFRDSQRDFYLLDENFYDGSFDLSIPFAPIIAQDAEEDDLAPKQRIKLGGAYNLRARDFDSRLFFFDQGTLQRNENGLPFDENGNPFSIVESPESLFDPRRIHPDGFILEEIVNDSGSYEGDWEILAGYAMADFRVHEDVRIVAGARAESSTQEVTTRSNFTDDVIRAELDTFDVLPSGSVAWDFWKEDPLPKAREDDEDEYEGGFQDKLQLRLAGSQTITRPEFRELSPFRFTNVEGGFETVGNPDLQREKVYNADLRIDWLPGPGDVISASVFYKYFDKPIEQVFRPLISTPQTSWANGEDADLWGFEVEVQKGFGWLEFIDPGNETLQQLDDFRLVFNYAWIESEVRIGQIQGTSQTNNTRALQGQPDFVFNVGITYESSIQTGFMRGVSVGVFANTFGDRISAGGSFGLPDEIEQQRWSLDFAIGKEFRNGGKLKISFQNLLDDEFIFSQAGIVTREYQLGWGVGASYSHSF